MPASVTPENGPAPTPARAVYGFLLYVVSVLAAITYLIWALVPPSWLKTLGLDYWPQQLWAVTVPTALLIALLLFVLVIYPLLGLLDAPGLDDPRVHVDEFSLPERPAAAGGIPPIGDIPLSEVCRHLYLERGEDRPLSPPSSACPGRDPAATGPERTPVDDPGRSRRSARVTDGAGTADCRPRIRSWSERDAERRRLGHGDVRWRSRADSWRVRRRRREPSVEGLSPDGDSPGADS